VTTARRTFHSLRYRNYRLFFGGQIVSQTGSWMQRIALGWYILQLTHSPFDVGVMAFAQFMPYMAFGLFAGVLTARLDALTRNLKAQLDADEEVVARGPQALVTDRRIFLEWHRLRFPPHSGRVDARRAHVPGDHPLGGRANPRLPSADPPPSPAAWPHRTGSRP